MIQLSFGILMLAGGATLMWFGGQQASEGWKKMHREDTNKRSIDIPRLSESDRENIVIRLAEQLKPELAKRYPEAHTVFGIAHDGFVVPNGVVPENIRIFWDTGSVRNISDDAIRVMLPDIFFVQNKMRFEGNIVNLPKRVGAKSKGLVSVGGVRFKVEVIGIQGDLVVVALGFEAKKDAQ